MLLQRYNHDLEHGGFSPDPAQRAAVEHLQRVYDEFNRQQTASTSNKSWLKKLFSTTSSIQSVRGLYLWGGVGRGKTYLMDLFFNTLESEQKRRFHFHRFMQRVHTDLKTVRDQQNPLQLIAQHWAEQTRIICLDEFFVSDITDAMLLGTLLEALFAKGIILVTTSNIEAG